MQSYNDTQKDEKIMPSLKPRIPHMLQSNVVYQITCPGCNSSYVGETVRHLSRRFRGLGGLVVYSSDSHGDGTGLILAAAFGYTLVTTNLYGG